MFCNNRWGGAKRQRGGTARREHSGCSGPGRSLLARAALSLLKAYRLYLSPLLPRRCRFHPTCSRYAMEAVASHGPVRGGALALKRLLRCHPFHPGGFDPVPPLVGGTGGQAESAAPHTRPPCR